MYWQPFVSCTIIVCICPPSNPVKVLSNWKIPPLIEYVYPGVPVFIPSTINLMLPSATPLQLTESIIVSVPDKESGSVSVIISEVSQPWASK